MLIIIKYLKRLDKFTEIVDTEGAIPHMNMNNHSGN